ncbi:MAG: MraY family glycosyltransferase [Patescibacteria group bacterium]|nr:MraY family glycosyltransferase [Patescibacteria group bacterium]
MLSFLLIFLLATFLSSGMIYVARKFNFSKAFLKKRGGIIISLLLLMGISLIYFWGNIWGVLAKDYWSILVAQLIIIAGGLADDRFNLKPVHQLFYQAGAAIMLLLVNDTIDHIKLPIIGLIFLPFWLNYILSFLWIIVVINAFNWFDGLDGLAGGVGFIGMMILFFLSLSPLVAQPQTATIALLTAGIILGFLFFNFYPAKVYLGSVGSGSIGLMLALLAIYSGGKVATAALILGIPLLDFIYVSFSRIINKQPPWRGGDRRHLHYRLLDAGVSERSVVLLMYVLSASFGTLALTLQTDIKILALGLLVFIFGGIIWLIKKRRASV